MTPLSLAIAVLAAFGGALAGTALVLVWIRRRGVLDVPNDRSSHVVPTPRGGGLAIVIVAALVWSVVPVIDSAAWWVVVLAATFASVAWVGWRDDLAEVPALLRLLVHTLAAGALTTAAWWIGAPGYAGFPDIAPALAVALYVLAIVWATNLYNFMDGIDGIAASQAVFLGSAGGFLCWAAGSTTLALVFATLAAASAGFLKYNWAPAKIFMGDVGSGALGIGFAGASVIAVEQSVGSIWTWCVLWGAFLADATTTLVIRLARRERIYAPHRMHAYQIIAAKWGHARTTTAYALVNVLCLFPAALAVDRWPDVAPGVAGGVLLLLCGAAILAGAGRPAAAARPG